jgi:hypothetical protein
MEGCDKEGGMVVKGVISGDGEEEVLVNVFILGAPDLLATFVDDSVLVRVVGDGSDTRRGSEEMREELGFWGDREREIGEDRSGWSGQGDNGNGGFNDRWWEVLDGDIGKGDSLNDFFKLEVDVGILVFGGWGILKLRAYYISLLGSDVSKEVEEVGQGGDNGGWRQGTVGIEACGRAVTTWAGIVPGVMRTVKVVLDDLVGGDDVNLVGVVDLGPISNREGRGDDEGG